MSKLNTLLAPALIGALLLSAPVIASADPASQTAKFSLDADAPVTIYTQPDTKHPAPIFLICAGTGVYSVDLTGPSGALETIPASSCVYASHHKISANITPGSLEKITETDEALRRTASWLDDRIADLESISESTEYEANILRTLKERRAKGIATYGRTQEPPHVFVTLVR